MKRMHVLTAGVLIAATALVVQQSVGGVTTAHPAGVYEGSSYECCTDFTSLTRTASAVVRARVVAVAPSSLIPYETPVTVDHPPIPLPGPKATAAASAPKFTAHAISVVPTEPGIVVTDFTIQVVDTLRGNVTPGQRLTVTQIGGTDPRGNQIVAANDPLFQIGQEEVLFLSPYDGDKYSTVGGEQGRFAIDATGIVHPLNPGDFPYTKAYDGKTVDDLKTATRAVQ